LPDAAAALEAQPFGLDGTTPLRLQAQAALSDASAVVAARCA